MGMQKGFFAPGTAPAAILTSQGSGSAKKNKGKNKQKKPTVADVFAVPNASHKPKKDVLDYR